MTYQVIIKKEDKSHKVINTNAANFKVNAINGRGLSAYAIALNNGFVGTEEEWILSLSTYGRALDNGFVGTEEEWLESLRVHAKPEDDRKILTNDGTESFWMSIEDKLNSESIQWDLGEFNSL